MKRFLAFIISLPLIVIMPLSVNATSKVGLVMTGDGVMESTDKTTISVKLNKMNGMLGGKCKGVCKITGKITAGGGLKVKMLAQSGFKLKRSGSKFVLTRKKGGKK